MTKLNVFISYSHKDESFKEALDTHLVMLKRSDKIATWNDRAILASTEWDNEIKQQLANAHIIVLLVSASFLASDYIWEEELTVAIQRHDKGTARIIPIFIKACDWSGAPFAKIQGLPRDAKPIGAASNDDAWTEVAKSIRAVVEDAQQRGLGIRAMNEVSPILANTDNPSSINPNPIMVNKDKPTDTNTIAVNKDELKKQLLTFVEENEFSEIFELFKADKSTFKGYKTFEDEYILNNPKGTDLKQFKDRVTTFFNSKL